MSQTSGAPEATNSPCRCQRCHFTARIHFIIVRASPHFCSHRRAHGWSLSCPRKIPHTRTMIEYDCDGSDQHAIHLCRVQSQFPPSMITIGLRVDELSDVPVPGGCFDVLSMNTALPRSRVLRQQLESCYSPVFLLLVLNLNPEAGKHSVRELSQCSSNEHVVFPRSFSTSHTCAASGRTWCNCVFVSVTCFPTQQQLFNRIPFWRPQAIPRQRNVGFPLFVKFAVMKPPPRSIGVPHHRAKRPHRIESTISRVLG